MSWFIYGLVWLVCGFYAACLFGSMVQYGGLERHMWDYFQ